MTLPVMWDNRLVKMLDETTWSMSAQGDVEDFDFYPDQLSPKRAAAGSFGTPAEKITEIVVINSRQILFVGVHLWLMTGNPCLDGFVEMYEKRKQDDQ